MFDNEMILDVSRNFGVCNFLIITNLTVSHSVFLGPIKISSDTWLDDSHGVFFLSDCLAGDKTLSF